MNFEQALYKSFKQSLFRKCLVPEKKGSLKPARQWRWQCIYFDNNRFLIEVRIKQNLILHKTSNMSVFIPFSQKKASQNLQKPFQGQHRTEIQISNQCTLCTLPTICTHFKSNTMHCTHFEFTTMYWFTAQMLQKNKTLFFCSSHGRRPWLPETQASRALRVSLAK